MSVILITGAGKGIGRHLALEFAKHKSPDFEPQLLLVSRTRSDLEMLQQECHAHQVEAEICVADIAQLEHIEKIYTCALQRFGKVDCLVNNAGVGRFKDILELTEEDFDYTININLKGTFFLTQRIFLSLIHI